MHSKGENLRTNRQFVPTPKGQLFTEKQSIISSVNDVWKRFANSVHYERSLNGNVVAAGVVVLIISVVVGAGVVVLSASVVVGAGVVVTATSVVVGAGVVVAATGIVHERVEPSWKHVYAGLTGPQLTGHLNLSLKNGEFTHQGECDRLSHCS